MVSSHNSPSLALSWTGGDLKLTSIPGYGVDAYLTLRALDDHSWEEVVDEPQVGPDLPFIV